MNIKIQTKKKVKTNDKNNIQFFSIKSIINALPTNLLDFSQKGKQKKSFFNDKKTSTI